MSETSGLRDRHKRRRRERITTAARLLLAEQGVEGLSMRTLAERAELSVSTLYNLHGSREEILVAVIESTLDDLARRVGAAPPGPPLVRLHHLIDAFLDLFGEDEAVHRAVLLAALADERKLIFIPSALRVIERVRDLLSEARRAGSVTGPLADDLVATELFDLCLFQVRDWANGYVSLAALRARLHYALVTMLMATCSESERAQLAREARRCESELRAAFESEPSARAGRALDFPDPRGRLRAFRKFPEGGSS